MTDPTLFKTATGAFMLKFDSMTQVTEYVDPTLFRSRDKSFVGEKFKEWDDAENMTQQPWDYGAEVLQTFVDRLTSASLPQLKGKVRKTEWSYTDGDEIDLERMQRGEPYMRRTIRESTHGASELTILIDVTTPYHMESEDVLWRGAAAVALVKLMEERGYRCEVWVVNGSELFADSRRPVMTACCLKRCSDPLDCSTLVGTVSGWFYRSVTFTLLDTICEKNEHPVAPGYGSCATPMPKDLDSVSTDEHRIYSSGVYSFSGALDMIVGEVQRAIDIQQGKDSETKGETQEDNGSNEESN